MSVVIERLETRQFLSLTASTGFSVSLVASKMQSPIAEDAAPDGRLFVAQQNGAVRIVQGGKLLAKPFITLAVDDSGDRGLFGIVLDPKFATNHFVYLYYTVPGNSAQHLAPHNRVSRITANGNVAVNGTLKTLFDLDALGGPTDHDTGALHFGTDGKLYISVGDTGTSTEAQSVGNLDGKMLRINSDGSIPADNPWYKVTTGKERAIWAIGFHNPFTFAVQPGTGTTFINDVGELTNEEIDAGKAGANYGWPATNGSFSQAQFPTYTEPFYSYNLGSHVTYGAAITGGAFYDPATQQFPGAFRNQYLFADYVSGAIKFLNAKTKVIQTLASGFTHPVDIDVASEGVVYILEYDNGESPGTGAVYQIRYKST
jgi:glucose/arabinose dehydrogenase